MQDLLYHGKRMVEINTRALPAYQKTFHFLLEKRKWSKENQYGAVSMPLLSTLQSRAGTIPVQKRQKRKWFKENLYGAVSMPLCRCPAPRKETAP
jgi:hypothetical protein